jgi:diguanylate cyclase (GGDEF)-like protein
MRLLRSAPSMPRSAGFGIGAKVILLALLCAVLPSALISILAIDSSRDALERGVRLELAGLARDRMASLQFSLQAAANNLGTWGTLNTMQNVLIDDVDGVIQNELVKLQKRYNNFADLLVVNPDGNVIAAAREANKGTNLTGKDFLNSALDGKDFQSDVINQKLTGALGITLSTPIRADYDPNTIVGALVGVVDWPRVQTDLRSVEIWGAKQDADHRLVLRTSSGQILYQSSNNEAGPLPVSDGVSAVEIGGRPFLVGTNRTQKSAGWVLHTMVATDVAYADIYLLRNRIALLSAAILAGALALGAFAASRLIVRPIRAVTTAMNNVAQGNTEIDLPGQDRGDEIGEMLRSISVFRNSILTQNELIREREQAAITQNLRFDAALSNMSQGLAMFDAEGRLVVGNRRFLEMYQIPQSLAAIGGTEHELVEHGASIGLYDTASALFYRERETNGETPHETLDLRDGRIFEIAHKPMAGGGWVSTHADVTERRRAEAQISHMARHDTLTNLPNRVLFRHESRKALKRAQRGENVAILCLDLDYFKQVNDTLGHPVGDALLCAVADRLRSNVRDMDTVARLGGDEFAIIQVGVEQPTSATALAQRVIDSLGAPYDIEDHQIVIGASVGISIAPVDGNDPDQVLKNADMALYRAKADGRGRYRFFEPEMDAKMQARRALELDLRRALVTEEFELYFQPLVSLETDDITGFEALLRWHHPTRGILSPIEFIPLAEEIGLIVPLGDWVLRKACLAAANWPSPIHVAVNLSPVQFKKPELVQSVFSALAKSGLSPERLELEITETVLLQDSEATLATLHQLREMGVRISMDDFGTGYSSLSYLRSFPFDKIKIDQSFVRDLATRNDSAVIVRAVTSIGKSLGIATTAEGVENAAQLQRLREEGCTEVQGYYLGRPVPIAETNALVARETGRRQPKKLAS